MTKVIKMYKNSEKFLENLQKMIERKKKKDYNIVNRKRFIKKRKRGDLRGKRKVSKIKTNRTL